MFAQEPSPPRFRLDAWASDYVGSVDLEDGDETETFTVGIDTDVETTDWSQPIVAPASSTRPRRIVFVDGVQRTEVWGRIETAAGSFDAALASAAVGAAVSYNEHADISYDQPNVHRIYAIAGPLTLPPYEIACGRISLRFEPEPIAERGRMGVSHAIGNRRADLERRFAESLVDQDALVVLDGRLSFEPGPIYQVVGMAKTMHRNYLEGYPEASLLTQLGACERTPVFRIRYGETTRYSWYLRLPFTRPIHHSLAGIVRLETPEIGEEAAVRLAHLTAFYLPAFASRPEHDPRAPQNLIPIGALEKRLRHEMGDPLWLRRSIEDYLYRDELPA
jgi:hypothetical protein